MATKWYLKTGDSRTIAQGSADFDFTKPNNIKRGDLFLARVGVRAGVTPAPVTSGDWTAIGNSPTTSNSTSGSDAAISKEFVWSHIYGNADPDWTFSRGGTTVALRGAITLAPALGYEFDIVETQTGTNGSGSTTPVTANFTTTIDDECIVVFLSTGRNATWSNWDAATDPSVASGASGYGTVGLIDPTTSWKRLQSNGTTSGADISGSIGLAVKDTAGSTGNIQVATNSLSVRPGWVGMRIQQVQATTLKVVNSGSAANYPTPGAVTIPFTPTSGNTLFAFVAIDKDATSDVTVTGWTREMQERSGTAVGAALFRKVSDGTESSFDPSYTGSGSGENVFFIEIEGEVEIDVSATATTNLSTPAKTSGTATTANTTAAGGLALAFWCNDSYGSCDTSTNQVFSNDFIMAPGPTTQQFYSNADAGTPAIAVGWKEIPSSGTAVSTSFTYTGDSDDENLLFLVVLKEVATGSVGTSAGSATASGVGAAHAGGVGNVSGVASVSAIAAAQAASAGSAAGVASSSVQAAAGFDTVGSSAGSSTATAQARANANSTVSVTGQATASFLAAASAAATASASGSATVTGSFGARAQAVGSAAGAASVNGNAAASFSAVGSSVSAASVSGVGAATFSAVWAVTAGGTVLGLTASGSVASSTGQASVSGVAAASASTSASAAGSSTTSGLGASNADAIASSDSIATVAGQLAAYGDAVAAATGQATTQAFTSFAEYADAIGSSNGAATVLGSGRALASAVGTAQGVAAVSVVARASFSSIAVSAGISAAEGQAAATAGAVGTSIGLTTVAGIARATGVVVPSVVYWLGSA
jgi:hypothetical protein